MRWKLCAPSALCTIVPGQTIVHVGIVEACNAASVTPRCRSRKSLAHCAPPKHLSTQELPGRNMSAGAPPVVNNTGEGLAAATALIVVRTASAACAEIKRSGE